ncbi:MAG: ferredoxin family protein [Deltaproteobacteria bacterium]|nr:ferredoxin family protein [Deltaproteobacteria bacterium]
MSLEIDPLKCNGCGHCVNICPGGLLLLNSEKKVQILFPYDCWGCTACLKACKKSALSLRLPAELGGHGGSLTVERQGKSWCFRVDYPNGEVFKYPLKAQTIEDY